MNIPSGAHNFSGIFWKLKNTLYIRIFSKESRFLRDSRAPLGKRGCGQGSSHRAVPAPTPARALKHLPHIQVGAAAPAGTQHCPSALRLNHSSSSRLGDLGKQGRGKPAAPQLLGSLEQTGEPGVPRSRARLCLETPRAPELGLQGMETGFLGCTACPKPLLFARRGSACCTSPLPR